MCHRLAKITYFSLLNYRRKVEKYYFTVFKNSFIYLNENIIHKMAKGTSLIRIFISFIPLFVISTTAFSKNSLLIFSIIFFKFLELENKINVFEINYPSQKRRLFIFPKINKSIEYLLKCFIIPDLCFLFILLPMLFIRLIIYSSSENFLVLTLSSMMIILLVKRISSYFYFATLATLVYLIFIIKKANFTLNFSSLNERQVLKFIFNLINKIPIKHLLIMLIIIGGITWSFKNLKRVNYLKQKPFKPKIKNIDRSYQSFINFLKNANFSELLKIMIPLDLFVITLISLIIKIPAKQDIYPIIISAMLILNIKQFTNQYAYFFHFFVDTKEEQFLQQSKKKLLLSFFSKLKIILISKISFLILYFITEGLYINHKIHLTKICSLVFLNTIAMIIPLLEKNFFIFNYKTVKLLGGIEYGTNFEAICFVVLSFLGIIVYKLAEKAMFAYFIYLDIFIFLFLSIITIYKANEIITTLKFKEMQNEFMDDYL